MDANPSASPRTVSRPASPFATLRRIALARDNPPSPPAAVPPPEKCELCSLLIAPEHRHLLEVATHKILCSCDACGLRFENVLDGRFKLIPRDVRSLPGFQLTDADWESLSLPINLAFFFHSSLTGKMTALYPSPAGATESLLPLPAWQSLLTENPVLAQMQSDVEALLVNRVDDRRLHYLAPIDGCFELVGLLRLHWRGLHGGEEVWREIDRFFARLEDQARPLTTKEIAHA
jgi:hypothetical protein